MKKTAFIFLLLLAGLSGAAQAQTARQLYLGYENTDKIAASTDAGKTTKMRPPKPPGKPGAKVVIERMRGGKLAFVSPNSKFRSGDKIRLRFTTNYDGYLKILNVGSSGKVNLLFPYDGADDRIKPSSDFQVPKNGDWIVFDDTPGTETLTVIMSNKPLNFESEDELRDLNKRAANPRDLTIESDTDATYAVTTQSNLENPIGFTLRLKHR
ncbi:MAG: DUF4384 domain-containing protein [Pyrinomonadaceae bacterium]|nr:DUF4384 domain-containing protein [Pyrinomonadaceae bacterium]